MDDDRKCISINDSEVDEAAMTVEQKKLSRCLLSAVCITLMAALSVTAVVVTLKILADSTVTYNVELRGDDGAGDIQTTAEIEADANNNIVEYHVMDPTKHQQTWAISDFNRALQIFKTVSASGRDVCYVTPLNSDETATPTEIINKPPTNNSKSESVTLYFDAMPSEIKDKSVLGSKGQLLCAATNAYWIVPRSCTEDELVLIRQSQAGNIAMVTHTIRHDRRPRNDVIRVRRGLFRPFRRPTPSPVQPPVDDDDSSPEGDDVAVATSFRMIGQVGRRRGRRPSA